ncbi:YihA family ribosome biogenesis GTP-binding protein, partial [Campylobacter coli]|nr:YihA family ribosome biogenesis GTP-binding protein [Campylobacter coli]EAK7129904.1 YihA family ribosome biogenesis GTP-binding protein [Campylobacter coli]EKH5234985.1 YihA family ribosome biogenesis GTP-binding protein [Campylobacter coli]
ILISNLNKMGLDDLEHEVIKQTLGL